MMRIRDLTVKFGGVTPLDRLEAEFTAPITGLIGPNGAGKTTLLNVLSGFVIPRSGEVLLDHISLLAHPARRRPALGLRRTFQQELVVESLTLRENVQAAADHLCRRGIDVQRQIDEAIDFVGLRSLANRPGRRLNLYERRMTELAKTMLGGPKFVLLDEPGAGMTEEESLRLREVVLAMPGRLGAQVLLIDHDATLIAAVCEETLVLDFGKRLAIGRTADVLRDPVVRAAYLGDEIAA